MHTKINLKFTCEGLRVSSIIFPTFVELKRRAARNAATALVKQMGLAPTETEIAIYARIEAERQGLSETDLVQAIRSEIHYQKDRIQQRKALANRIVAERSADLATPEGRRRAVLRKVEADNHRRAERGR